MLRASSLSSLCHDVVDQGEFTVSERQMTSEDIDSGRGSAVKREYI